ncbi:MAG: hypothetical protein Q8L24_02190 [bacterium]|nr:hypothetical protein [bacterium]
MSESVQRFNVLCVTKRSIGDRCAAWHRPITGIAEVFVHREKEMGVWIVKTMVRFQGMECPPLYVRPGLCGMAVTIAIKRVDGCFDIWELYTDTPVGKCTAEQVRRIAESEIAKNSRW